MENFDWTHLLYVAIPASAPLITAVVERFGSPKVKSYWAVVRRAYRKLLGMKPT